jgi:hypothetical protein
MVLKHNFPCFYINLHLKEYYDLFISQVDHNHKINHKASIRFCTHYYIFTKVKDTSFLTSTMTLLRSSQLTSKDNKIFSYTFSQCYSIWSFETNSINELKN